jgi:Protein of unknown function (DUF4058)
MPSPFPGMNPWLEHVDAWEDFHATFLPLAKEFLQSQLRQNYYVKVSEHLFVSEWSDEDRLVGISDVSLSKKQPSASAVAGTATIAAPARGRVPAMAEERVGYLEVRDGKDRQVITAIELLSPSNKRGSGREQYLAKRSEFISAGIHLVEIDLLRGGKRPPIEGLPQCAYYVLVSRMEECPEVGLWPIQLRERLPDIPIPLRAPDADAHLDLQALLHRVYDLSAYEDYIYDTAPDPPLAVDEAEWAKQILSK